MVFKIETETTRFEYENASHFIPFLFYVIKIEDLSFNEFFFLFPNISVPICMPPDGIDYTGKVATGKFENL